MAEDIQGECCAAKACLQVCAQIRWERVGTLVTRSRQWRGVWGDLNKLSSDSPEWHHCPKRVSVFATALAIGTGFGSVRVKMDAAVAVMLTAVAVVAQVPLIPQASLRDHPALSYRSLDLTDRTD